MRSFIHGMEIGINFSKLKSNDLFDCIIELTTQQMYFSARPSKMFTEYMLDSEIPHLYSPT